MNPERARLRCCTQCARWYFDDTRNKSKRRCSRACTIAYSNARRGPRTKKSARGRRSRRWRCHETAGGYWIPVLRRRWARAPAHRSRGSRATRRARLERRAPGRARSRASGRLDERHAPITRDVAPSSGSRSRQSGWKASDHGQQYEPGAEVAAPYRCSARSPGHAGDGVANVRQAITRWQDGGLSARRIEPGAARREDDPQARSRAPAVAPARIPSPPCRCSAVAARPEIDPLSPEEIAGLPRGLPRPGGVPYFGVAFWTGARDRTSSPRSKWGDVDGASARLRIRAGRYRGRGVGAEDRQVSVRDRRRCLPARRARPCGPRGPSRSAAYG